MIGVGRSATDNANPFTDWLAGRLLAAAGGVGDRFPEAARRFRTMALCAKGEGCRGRCELAAATAFHGCPRLPGIARPAAAG